MPKRKRKLTKKERNRRRSSRANNFGITYAKQPRVDLSRFDEKIELGVSGSPTPNNDEKFYISPLLYQAIKDCHKAKSPTLVVDQDGEVAIFPRPTGFSAIDEVLQSMYAEVKVMAMIIKPDGPVLFPGDLSIYTIGYHCLDAPDPIPMTRFSIVFKEMGDTQRSIPFDFS